MHLHLDHVCKSFGAAPATPVLHDLSARFDDVHALALIGPSGGGKSTLLRLLAGLERPTSGTITVDGEPIPDAPDALRRYRSSVGVVFQSFNLFPHLSALENLTLPLTKVHGYTESEAREHAMSALERFQLSAHAHKRPAALSGGQKQRVAIARAIAIRPRLLFFDEPTSALDPEMTAEVLDVIAELREQGSDFVLVTHEMGFARQVADCVAFLSEGRLIESGPAEELFEKPRSRVCRDFLSRILRY